MKKKRSTLVLLLTALVLILVGTVLLVFSFSFSAPAEEPIRLEADGFFESLSVSLSDCTLEIKSAEKTSIAVYGYHENAFSFSVLDGVLTLSDDLTPADQLGMGELTPKPEGIGRYWKEKQSLSEQKKIVLFLSGDDAEKTASIRLKNGAVTLLPSLSHLTLSAENTAVTGENLAFDRLTCRLDNCQTTLSMAYKTDTFSCNIETFDTDFWQNGSRDGNSDYHHAGYAAPQLELVTYGGRCELLTASEE